MATEKNIPAIPPIQRPDDSVKWYAMRVTYRRELAVRDTLEEGGMECFVPLRLTIKVDAKGRRKKVMVPIVNSLIFVHARQSQIQAVKVGIPHLQYIVDKNRAKITVPEKQMTQFKAVCGTYDESLLFFDPQELNLTQGTPVRIIGGEFEGYEGIFMKVKGKRDRRVVIAIEGVIAVVMATIHPNFIQPI